MDMGADDDADGRWLGYGELAALRGIDRTSALKLALRNKWRKQRDNRGQVRVYVPTEFLTIKDKSTPSGAAPRAAPAVDMSTVTNAFATAIASLTARAEAAEASLKQARADAEAAKLAADVSLTAERAASEAARARADHAEGRATIALALLREASEALQVEQAAKRAAEAERSRADALQAALDQARVEAEETALAAEAVRKTAERPNLVASKIDEVQFRRLQEAEQARKAMGRLARLRRAWRG